MLRIKLVKTGKTNRPMWRVVVVEKTRTGKGRVTDYIGNYNAHARPKVFNIDVEKYDKWIKNGAQPTDTVLRLKGKFTDKTKEYQKTVKPKIYKKKKPEPEEVKKPASPAGGEAPKKVEEVKEEVAENVETPAEEVKEVVEEKVEEKKEEEKAS